MNAIQALLYQASGEQLPEFFMGARPCNCLYTGLMMLWVMLASSLCHAEDGFHHSGMHCQQAVSGHFMQPHRIDSILIQTEPLDNANHCGAYVGLIYQPSISNHPTVRMPDIEALNDDTHVNHISVCHNGMTGLDALMISEGDYPTRRGVQAEHIFVYFDANTQSFQKFLLSPFFLHRNLANHDCPIQAMRIMQNRMVDLQDILGTNMGLQEQLQAPWEMEHALGHRHVDFDIHQIRTLLDALNQKILQLQGQKTPQSTIHFGRFGLTVLTENARWQVALVGYRASSDDNQLYSWGVLLAQDKKTGDWSTFYNFPKGEKIPLYLPADKNVTLNSDILHLHLYNGLKFAAFSINLNTFAYQ